MSYWYGTLYVVIEGWRELQLTDPAVDTLLDSPNVELLRRYRNGTFHFQSKYFDERLTEFMGERTTVDWTHSLTEAFDSYFKKILAKSEQRKS